MWAPLTKSVHGFSPIVCFTLRVLCCVGSCVMAYQSVLESAKSAESEAFRRLLAIPNLDDWDEAFGAWLRAVRSLQRASAAGSR